MLSVILTEQKRILVWPDKEQMAVNGQGADRHVFDALRWVVFAYQVMRRCASRDCECVSVLEVEHSPYYIP